MYIGFDLDQIFIQYPAYISSKIVDRLYKQKTQEGLSYRIPSRAEQLFRLATHTQTFRKPMKENLLFLAELKRNQRDSYYLITGRFDFLKKRTEAFIKKHNFDTIFDGMYFNYKNEQPHLFKDSIIKKLHLDRYVDDDFDLLNYLAQRNANTTFFWLNKRKEGKVLDNLIAVTKLQPVFD